MTRAALLAVALAAACGGKNNDNGATEFVDATRGVDEPVERLLQALFALDVAEKTGRHGLAQVEEFSAAMIEARAVSDRLAEQTRVAPGGDLAACADGWYVASDALVAALAPVVAELEKGSSGKGRELEDFGRVQLAWLEHQAAATERLCDLHRAGAACSAALKRYAFESVHRYSGADRVCR